MSHPKNGEQSQGPIDETIEKMNLSDSEDTFGNLFKESPCLPSPPDASESDDDTSSTSEAVDPSERDILCEQSNRRVKKQGTVSLDLSESTCSRSDSEVSTNTQGSSDIFSFFLPRPGLMGVYDEYVFQMMRMRDRGYLLPFEIIWLAFAVTCCFMGAYYWPLCPADVFIPRYVFFNGAIATLGVCVEIMDSVWKLLIPEPLNYRRYLCAFGFFWVAVITTLIEMIQFYTMSYSFQWDEENYCNEKFYWFVYYKNIVFGVLMSLNLMIYIPSFHCNYYLDNIEDYE